VKRVGYVGREHVGSACAPAVDPVMDESAPICQLSLEVRCLPCEMQEWFPKCVDVGNARHGECGW
jgi:hypothetical protein